MKSYNAIFDEQHEPRDAFKIKTEQLPDFDLLAAGFPCQSFSVAGEGKGFEDTKGTLFFEIARIAEAKLPSILLLENVRGLLSNSDGETFRKVLSTLDELGYDVQWQVLNSKYHGVPQNRERVFIVAHLREKSWPEVFPIREPSTENFERKSSKRQIIDNNGKLKDIFGTISSGGNSAMDDSDADFLATGELNYIGSLSDNTWLEEDSDKSRGHHEGNRVYGVDGVSPTLAKNKGGFSGSSQVVLDVVSNKVEIRKLTERECWRLQGFPDWAFERAQPHCSRTQLYQQAGNAVTVDVVKDIGEKLLAFFSKESGDD